MKKQKENKIENNVEAILNIMRIKTEQILNEHHDIKLVNVGPVYDADEITTCQDIAAVSHVNKEPMPYNITLEVVHDESGYHTFIFLYEIQSDLTRVTKFQYNGISCPYDEPMSMSVIKGSSLYGINVMVNAILTAKPIKMSLLDRLSLKMANLIVSYVGR